MMDEKFSPWQQKSFQTEFETSQIIRRAAVGCNFLNQPKASSTDFSQNFSSF